jgi:hypothetical protein
MTISAQKIPEVHRLIAKLLVENGGKYKGTNQLCESIQATRDGVLRSLRNAKKYRLIRSIHPRGSCGRGHQTIWVLTEKGREYVQS